MIFQSIIIIILLILLIGSIAIIHRSVLYANKYENARVLDNIQISDLYDELKSGDIIIYKCNTIFLPNVFLTHEYFTHIGMVVKMDNCPMDEKGDNNDPYRIKTDLYISETNPSFEYLPRNYDKRNFLYTLKPFINQNYTISNGWNTNYGADLLPLLVRIKYYPGESFIMRLNKNLDKNRENILLNNALEKFPYPTIVDGINILIEEKFGIQKTKARHCFQHVGNLLDKMNMTNNILSSGIYSICHKMANIYDQQLNDGYKYEAPVRIIYDI